MGARMSDDDSDEDGLDFAEIAKDPDGRFRLDRVLTALRGVGSPKPNLLPAIVLGLVGSVPVGLVVGWLQVATVAHALDTAGTYLTLAAALGFMIVLFRTENYYEGDETVAAERLKARYAAGEIDHQEFQRRVEPVLREGPAALADDADADDGEDTSTDDPEAILRRRYAAGDLDQAEYERRLATLRDTAADDSAATDAGERERERERERA